MRAIRSVSVGVFLFVALLAGVASAQQATIVGTVTDESKAVLPGVTVTVSDRAKGRSSSRSRTRAANTCWSAARPATTRCRRSWAGSRMSCCRRSSCWSARTPPMPFTMKVAAVSETLRSPAKSPLVDTTSTQVSGNVNRRQMEEVPLLGRNWLELAKMVPGMTANVISTSNPGVSAEQLGDEPRRPGGGQQDVAGPRPAEVQPRSDRRIPDRDEPVRRHAGRFDRRSAAGDHQVRHEPYPAAATGSSATTASTPRTPVSNTVLPYHDDQWGATLGGPWSRTSSTTSSSFDTSGHR